MSEQNNSQTGNEDANRAGPWKRRFGLIGIFALALLLLPPLSPWLRVIAVALPAWAVLEGFDLLPRLRAKWQRLISALPNDDERRARWTRAWPDRPCRGGVHSLATLPAAHATNWICRCDPGCTGRAWRLPDIARSVSAFLGLARHHVAG
jgi:hypothetical protein